MAKVSKRSGGAGTGGNPALSKPFAEMGASGLRQFSGYVREEFLRDLTGWRGLRKFREMRDNDPVIGGMFFAVERLLMGVDFTIEPGDAAKPEDIEAAAFVNSCISDTEQSWLEFISEVLTFLQYGYSVHEIVYKKRNGQTNDPKTRSKYNDGMIGWRKFAGRAQETLLHWNFNESGDAIAMVQLLPTGGPLLAVPLAKCLHFKTRLLKNNPEGVSLLRNAYVPWYRKTRIEDLEAIGLERDLAGLPICWVPPRILASDATDDDKAQLVALKQMVRDTVRNQQEGFVFPLAYDKDKNKMYDFTLLSTAGKRQFDTTAIVDRYDHRILATWLADFIVLGTGSTGGRGSFAQSKNKTDLFSVAAESFLDLIDNEFNQKAIPDLLTLNTLPGACKMRHGKITENDVVDFANAINALTSVGMLTYDARTEATVRGLTGLPPMDGPDGEQEDDLATGSDAEAGGDNDPSDDNPSEGGQGRGAGAAASDLGPANKRARRRTRKKR